MNRKLRGFLYTIPGIIIGVGASASCNKVTDALGSVAGDLAKQCGLECPATDADGVIGGNASISGVASLDAFFASVIRFQTTADAISGGIQGELNAIAASVGANANDSADLKTKLTAKINAAVTGGIKVAFQPPECTVSAHATLEAQAKCDATVDPGSASVKCQGSCTADASAKVDCGADATLSCTGTAPSLTCSGSCKGDCELTTSLKCDGTCNGTCTGTCTVHNAKGDCAGSCQGTCQGTCRLDAAGSCGGSCKGDCTYTPASGQCDATAQAHCDARASAEVDCKGTCTGKVTPPTAKAECNASAKADASVSADCKPPTLNVTYQLSAAVMGDATASAQFTAWLEGFKGHVSAILAYKAKLDGLVAVGTDIAGSAETAVTGSIKDISAKGGLNVKVTVGLTCATQELPKAITMVTDAGTKLKASGTAAVDLLGTVGAT